MPAPWPSRALRAGRFISNSSFHALEATPFPTHQFAHPLSATRGSFIFVLQDMQLSMFLLGNAFRLDSGKPPEKVRQVKEAKAFFAEVEKLRKAQMAGDASQAKARYQSANEALNIYLNDVELPPSFDAMYKEEADMKVPST